MSFTEAQKLDFSEQDTATKLVLPTLHSRFGFPKPTSSEYTEQRTIPRTGAMPGRYDGMYSFGGYPIAILEVKAYSHQVLTHEDFRQARDYATSPSFTTPLPYLIISNGTQYRFYARTEDLDTDGKPKYVPVSQRFWDEIKDKNQGEEVQFIDVDELVEKFVKFQRDIFNDLNGFVYDASSSCYDMQRLPLLL
jgi:type I site-specific restriction-modification system R (restriction) subunit